MGPPGSGITDSALEAQAQEMSGRAAHTVTAQKYYAYDWGVCTLTRTRARTRARRGRTAP